MNRSIRLGVVLVVAVPVLSAAKEFPLTFQPISSKQVMRFAGGYGNSGMLRLVKPDDLRQAPPAVSRHPLYGQFGNPDGSPLVLYRLDESKGDGKGYDRLIIDSNLNHDLTDDPVLAAAEPPAGRRSESSSETALFGPIEMPVAGLKAGWHGVYFVQMYLSNRRVLEQARNREDQWLGQVRLRAGWYLETTVDLDGVRQKLGIIDGNANLRLGDGWKPEFTRSGAKQENWFFRPGDTWLRDLDGSGKFESDPLAGETEPFGPILYLGNKAYRITLGQNCQSVLLEPWAPPLAELRLQPHGEQVQRLTLAWELEPGQWQLLKPDLAGGRARVPPGKYRLYECQLRVPHHSGEPLVLQGQQRTPTGTVTAEAGKSVAFDCGAPLEIKLSSKRDPRRVATADAGSRRRGFQQLIEAAVIGRGGETYSQFFLGGPVERHQPAAPSFRITNAAGQDVGAGNLEYG